MHTLIFGTHTAILDPTTGMGVLILPDPANADYPENSYCQDQSAVQAALRWFGNDTAEYDLILLQLGSVGWELPPNNEGMPAWFAAGCTDCCGRSMISLLGLDAIDEDPNLQQLVEVSKQIQDLAALACCGIAALTESIQ
jgi:hypothetical protein